MSMQDNFQRVMTSRINCVTRGKLCVCVVDGELFGRFRQFHLYGILPCIPKLIVFVDRTEGQRP